MSARIAERSAHGDRDIGQGPPMPDRRLTAVAQLRGRRVPRRPPAVGGQLSKRRCSATAGTTERCWIVV